jgi:phage baseplate assembly protein W
MIDLQINTVCDHHIRDEVIMLDGMSPFYYADLRFPTNMNTNEIQVREHYNTEQNPNYVFFLDGITDFVLQGSQRLQFNNLLFAPGVNFVEGLTSVIPNKIYEVDYLTPLTTCPKCLGLKFVKDVNFDRLGQLTTLTGIDRARQNILKMLLTVIGNNVFNPDYGSTLNSAIGEKLTPTIFFKLQQSIVNAVQSLIQIQAQEIDILPAEEIVLGLNNLSINTNSQDPRLIDIVIEVLVGTFQAVNVNLQMRVQ